MGVLALELSGGSAPAAAALPQVQAGQLADLLARDLGKLVPGASALDLVFAAAHFDPAEVLRPGWPLHRRLDELRQRAPGRGQGPRVIAFGADREGQVPLPLRRRRRTCTAARCGYCRSCCSGAPQTVRALQESFEDVLLDRGMAGADTALLVQAGLRRAGRTRALPDRARPGRDHGHAVPAPGPAAAVAGDRDRAAGAGPKRNGWTRRPSRCCVTPTAKCRSRCWIRRAWQQRNGRPADRRRGRNCSAATNISRRASASSRRCWKRTAYR